MILITGANGQLGKATIEYLLKKMPPSEIAGLVRDKNKNGGLDELSIEIRQGDYENYESLVTAFKGIDKLLLISAPAFTDLEKQHKNAIDAAKEAGVQHIIYTSIYRNQTAQHIVPWVTDANRATEEYLKRSGIDYTIVQNNFYADNLPFFFGNVLQDRQVIVPAGNGKVSFVTRNNLAEANAEIISGKGHENKTYALTGPVSYSFADIAALLSELAGYNITYVDTSPEQFIRRITSAGFPAPVAAFWVDWSKAFEKGDMDHVTDTLQTLLGRKPDDLKDFFRQVWFSADR